MLDWASERSSRQVGRQADRQAGLWTQEVREYLLSVRERSATYYQHRTDVRKSMHRSSVLQIPEGILAAIKCLVIIIGNYINY